MALAIAVMLLPWSEFAIEGLEAIVPWLPVEVVMFGSFIGVIAVIIATVTIPVMRLALKGWMRRKIRRLKQAVAKMPKHMVYGWSFMEPDWQRATGWLVSRRSIIKLSHDKIEPSSNAGLLSFFLHYLGGFVYSKKQYRQYDSYRGQR